MKRKPAVVHKFLRLIILGLSVSLVVLSIFSKRGVLDLKRMWQENSNLHTKLLALNTQKAELEDQIRRFENNSSERERVVRQVLGYIKSNETVIEFE